MTGRDILDIINSFQTFLILVAIFVSIWLLILKKEKRSKTPKKDA